MSDGAEIRWTSDRISDGYPMDVPMDIRWGYDRHPMEFRWQSLTVFRWSSDGSPDRFPIGLYGSSDGYPMDLPMDVRWKFRWISDGALQDLRRTSDGSSDELPMELQWCGRLLLQLWMWALI